MRKSSIPNIFTFINLSFGILSLLATFKSEYLLAAIFILLAGLVDRYDGRVARYLNVSSDLGKELDSLADLVSFGVAPSVLTFVFYNFESLGPMGIIGYALLLCFPICGAFRLARYNATEFDGVFRGVPITIAGAVVALFILLSIKFTLNILFPVVILVVFSYLMVSNLQLKKIFNKNPIKEFSLIGFFIIYSSSSLLEFSKSKSCSTSVWIISFEAFSIINLDLSFIYLI